MQKLTTKVCNKKLYCSGGLVPRVGVIIDCTQNNLYHDARDIIITSQMAVRELDNDEDNDDDKHPLVVWNCQHF